MVLLAWGAFISIPLHLGVLGISWDALNHHIYLGWTAESPRFDQDFLAASFQSYQFPYLYWPIYKLSTSGLSGAYVGAILASLHLVVVPPIWMVAKTCIPGNTWFDVLMRFMAMLMAFISSVVLSQLDSTANDLLAAAPLVWAIALALSVVYASGLPWLTPRQVVLLSGLFSGVSVAFKLSNGPLAILLPLLWLLSARSSKDRIINTTLGCVAATSGFLLTYGFWGWQLWDHFGNPIYPFYDGWFAVLRTTAGWSP